MLHGLGIPSVFLQAQAGRDLFCYGRRIYVAGALSDRVLNVLRGAGEGTEVVQDFTRIFALPRAFYAYEKAGGCVSCLLRNELLAVTVNPMAPSGYRLDSRLLCETLAAAIGRPVYDVRALRAAQG